jgi:zinc-ribbon domain
MLSDDNLATLKLRGHHTPTRFYVMPYCQKCGTKLEEDARFCYRCGTPVAAAQTRVTYERRPRGRNPFLIPVIVIAAIILSALIITAFATAPINPVNFNQTSQIIQPNVDHLNLDFQADIAEVNVFTNLTDKTLLIDVSATGSNTIFGSETPVKFTVENNTVNNGEVVTARVTTVNFPLRGNLHVVCNIYVNPALSMTLNVRSNVGQVNMNTDSTVKIEALNLQTTTGITQLNLKKGTVINGDLSLKTTTGIVLFNMDQANVRGNVTVNLQSTTGSVNMNITQTQKLAGNVQINANTQTGEVNLDRMLIDGDVSARIESHTALGRITVNSQNFAGNQSPIESDNYPAASNFKINMNTNLGNININANYQTSTIPTVRN